MLKRTVASLLSIGLVHCSSAHTIDPSDAGTADALFDASSTDGGPDSSEAPDSETPDPCTGNFESFESPREMGWASCLSLELPGRVTEGRFITHAHCPLIRVDCDDVPDGTGFVYYMSWRDQPLELVLPVASHRVSMHVATQQYGGDVLRIETFGEHGSLAVREVELNDGPADWREPVVLESSELITRIQLNDQGGELLLDLVSWE